MKPDPLIVAAKKNELLEGYQLLYDSVPKEKRKYIHYRTVNNLIVHINEIQSDSDFEWVYKNLKDFLAAAPEISPFFDRKDSIELFSTYLNNIVDYYAVNLKFFYFSFFSIYWILHGGLYFLYTIFFSKLVSGILAITGVMLHFSRVLRKYNQQRTAGIFH